MRREEITPDAVIYVGDCRDGLRTMPDECVSCCVTSPPYWGLRDYGCNGQLGLESTPEGYTATLVAVFREVRRVLRDDGTLWLNLGDTYGADRGGTYMPAETLAGGVSGQGDSSAMRGRGGKADGNARRNCTRYGLKHKDLVGIPWRVAFALQADGWYLRQDIIWHKPNPMPESVTDRCTKSHEYVFLLAKSERYYYDAKAIMEPGRDWGSRERRDGSAFVNGTPGRSRQSGGKNCDFSDGRNKRSVWTVATHPCKEAHFATFPPALITPMILAGCPIGGTVLDPFAGSGTTGMVALDHGRKFVGCELNPQYADMAKRRIGQAEPSLFQLR